MTVAVCIECGEHKHGALSKCGRCWFKPYFEDDVVKSLLFSDHYFSEQELVVIGKDNREGRSSNIDIQTFENYKRSLQKQGVPLIQKNNDNQKSFETAKAYFVADELRTTEILLHSARSEPLRVTEVILCIILSQSKIHGWTGGRRFFCHDTEGSNNLFYPIKLESHMGIYGQEAISLSHHFIEQLKENGSHDESNQFINEFKKICECGGFAIEVI